MTVTKKIKKCFRYALVALVGFAVGYAVGYAVVYTQVTAFCVDVGLKFLAAHNITVDIDAQLIKQALWQYKENIGSLSSF